MNPAQNFCATHSYSSSLKSRVEEVHHVALLGAPLTDNRALGPTVDECLYRVPIDFDLYVQHCDMAKKLWVVLHGILIVLLNHVFANLLFDHLLCFDVVRVCVLKFSKSFLLSSLLFECRLQSFTDNFADFLVIA